MKMKRIYKPSYVDIIVEAHRQNNPCRRNKKNLILEKVAGRIIEKKISFDQMIEANRLMHQESYLKALNFQYGKGYATLVKVLKLCPKFLDRWELIEKK